MIKVHICTSTAVAASGKTPLEGDTVHHMQGQVGNTARMLQTKMHHGEDLRKEWKGG